MDNKNTIRALISKQRKTFIDSGMSLKLCKKLKAQKYWENAKNILIYSPIKGEVDVMPLFSSLNKKFYFPRIRTSSMDIYEINNLFELEETIFGIREPKKTCYKLIDLSIIDLIIVPGVAFTKEGKRLGRGGGYYDKFLDKIKKLNKKIPTVALAFDFQIFDDIPTEDHDISMDLVIII